MPGIYYGMYGNQYETYAEQLGSNCGQWPLGHYLILPDGRQYRHALNDGTTEVAGNLYQSPAPAANHLNQLADVARAIGAVTLSAAIGATAAAIDLYSEGTVHVNADAGAVGYLFRIKRAVAAGDAHAAAAGSDVLTVNLTPGESLQVAITTATNLTFMRNRFHTIIISPAGAATGQVAGVSPGVAAANRYYWSQVVGPAAVLTDGTVVVGQSVAASDATAGAVEAIKYAGTTPAITEQNGPPVGEVISVNATTEYSAIYLKIS